MREGLDPEGGNKKCQRRTEEEGDEGEPPNQGAEGSRSTYGYIR